MQYYARCNIIHDAGHISRYFEHFATWLILFNNSHRSRDGFTAPAIDWGPFTYDVTEILGFFRPPPHPLVRECQFFAYPPTPNCQCVSVQNQVATYTN